MRYWMIAIRMVNNKGEEIGLEVTKKIFVTHGNCAEGPGCIGCHGLMIFVISYLMKRQFWFQGLVTLPAAFTITKFYRDIFQIY